jgi:protein phosphatase
VLVDVQSINPEIGDLYLLCSDGLNSMLEDPVILDIVQAHRHDLAEMAASLIEYANEAGGEDNCTVVLVEVAEE